MIGKTTNQSAYEVPKNTGTPSTSASTNTKTPQKAEGFAVNGSSQFLQGFWEKILSSLGVGSEPVASIKNELAAPSFGNPAVPATTTQSVATTQPTTGATSGGITMDTGSSKKNYKNCLEQS